MAALILPHRYRAQARGLVEVDYSHPLAAGLVSAYNMTSAPLRTSADATGRYDGRKSSAGKNPYTLHGYKNDGTTEAGHVYCAEGAVWDFGGTYATKAYNTKHPKSWAGAVTFVIRVLLRSNTANQCLIGNFNDSVNPDYLYGAGLYVTGGTLYAVGANNNSKVLSVAAPDVGVWVTLACVTNTADGKLSINGQVVASGDLSGAQSIYSFAIGCAGHTAAGATDGAAFLDGLVGPALVFNRALSDADLRSISENPYQILRPANDRLWLDVVAGGGGVSGTLAAIDVADTASLTGTISAPSATGSLAASDAPDAGAFAGALTFAGSLAAAEAQDAAALSGTAFAPGFSGTLAATEASDSAAFSGALSFVGSITATEPQDQISLTGSTGSGGALAATESVDTASLAGAFGAASFSGLLAATEATDVFAVSGSVMAPPIIGSLMASDGQDVAVLAGYVPVYGVCAANDPIDYCVLAGAFGVPAGLRRTGASFSALRPPLNTPSALRPGSGAVRFGRNR